MSDATPPIVVGFDASDGSRAALRWAMDEGDRTGTPVSLVYAFTWPVMDGGFGLAPAVWPDYGMRDEAAKAVSAALAEVRQSHPGVEVTGTVAPGADTAVLVERSRSARLVVLGGRGAGGFAGQLVGSTSVSVSAHARCPVVVVRGRQPAPGAPVAVGFDGSEWASLALEFGFAAAASRETGLRVVHAGEPAAEVDTAWLASAGRDRYPRVPVTVDVVDGGAAPALVDASRDASLVAVGSRGRGGFRGLLLGSVSQQLLYHAECPVAVVRELPA